MVTSLSARHRKSKPAAIKKETVVSIKLGLKHSKDDDPPVAVSDMPNAGNSFPWQTCFKILWFHESLHLTTATLTWA
jgi:hypothetical protein